MLRDVVSRQVAGVGARCPGGGHVQQRPTASPPPPQAAALCDRAPLDSRTTGAEQGVCSPLSQRSRNNSGGCGRSGRCGGGSGRGCSGGAWSAAAMMVVAVGTTAKMVIGSYHPAAERGQLCCPLP
jgi:hypothetical protein